MRVLEEQELDFKYWVDAESNWPGQLPAATWNSFVLNKEQANKGLDLAAKNASFSECFKSVFPQLSFVQIGHIYLDWSLHPCQEELGFTWESLLQQYNLRWSSNLVDTFELFRWLSPTLLDWAHSKKCKLNDLAPLRRFSEKHDFLNQLLECMVNLNPSKSEGTELIDNICDLVELKEAEELQDLLNSDSLKSFKIKLRKLRYPMSQSKESRSAQIIQKWPWPLHSQVKWTRVGDKAGVEIKLFASTQAELEKHIAGLNKTLEHSQNSKELPW